jgi:hypothetical protein
MGVFAMSGFPDSQIMNYVVRMVVPMRREFGRHLDVQQFLRDDDYARSVLDEALTSQDARLLEYARYVSQRLLSARIAAPSTMPGHLQAPQLPTAPHGTPASSRGASPSAPTVTPLTPSPGVAPPAGPATEGHESEQDLRAKVLRKYTTGLR